MEREWSVISSWIAGSWAKPISASKLTALNPANYFDNAATTQLHPAVREAMLPWLSNNYGNPNSQHSWGQHAREAVEESRAKIASLLKLEDPSQITFTSGATEACNTIVHLLNPESTEVSPFEHSAIRVPSKLKGIPLTQNQSPNQILTACSNETGILYSTAKNWFCDATQIIGKLPFDLNRTEAAAFSAHKFHGPMGVGVLYLKDPTILQEYNAHQVGGGQEHGRRAGTLNVPCIVGLAKALETALENPAIEHAVRLRNIVKNELEKCRFNESTDQSPFILSVTVPGIAAQTLVLELDRIGFAISSGAACSTQSTEPSPVLTSMGLTESEAMSTFRISFSSQNTIESVMQLAISIKTAINQIKSS